MAKHGSLVNIPKWFKMVEMVNLYVFDHLGPFWAFFETPCSLVYPLGAAILNLSVYRLTSGSFRTNLAIL